MQQLSEKSILERIHYYFPNKAKNLLLGRGDDCAVLSLDEMHKKNLVVTTDIFAQDIHFRSSYFTAQAIGYKALAVNISDIYSMGAKVESAQLALCLPKDIEKDYLDTLLSSLAKLASEHGFTFSGGDISRAEKLTLSITLLGLVDKEVQLYRNNAQKNDSIFLVGDIGLSKLALTLLENEVDDDINNYPKALEQHLYPKMHKVAAAEIALFAKKYKDEKFSLMDVSDGLAQDIPRLLEDFAYTLTLNEDNLDSEIKTFCEKHGYSLEKTLEFAIKGGEDYALLGTCPEKLFDEFQKACPSAKKIGFVGNRGEKQRILSNKNTSFCLSAMQGFDHFN